MKTKHILLLALRILVGGMIAFAGMMKLLDMGMTAENFAGMGITPIAVVWLVAAGETLAGLGILFGVYTQIAAAGAAIIMAGAVYYTSVYAGLNEVLTATVFLIGSVILMYTGSGKFALKPCPCSIEDAVPTASVSATI